MIKDAIANITRCRESQRKRSLILVSTDDQTPALQFAALKEAECAKRAKRNMKLYAEPCFKIWLNRIFNEANQRRHSRRSSSTSC